MTGPRRRPEAHCGRDDCRCLHDGCFKGWIDGRDESGREVAVPCPNCRANRLRLPGETDRAWKDRLRHNNVNQAQIH